MNMCANCLHALKPVNRNNNLILYLSVICSATYLYQYFIKKNCFFASKSHYQRNIWVIWFPKKNRFAIKKNIFFALFEEKRTGFTWTVEDYASKVRCHILSVYTLRTNSLVRNIINNRAQHIYRGMRDVVWILPCRYELANELLELVIKITMIINLVCIHLRLLRNIHLEVFDEDAHTHTHTHATRGSMCALLPQLADGNEHNHLSKEITLTH